MNNQDFGKFISALRKEKGLTQKELGEKLNLTDKAISRWENGKSYPDIEMLESISKELDVSISELIACRKIETDKEAATITERAYIDELIQGKMKKRRIKVLSIILVVILLLILIALPIEKYYGDDIYASIAFSESEVVQVIENIYRVPKDNPNVFYEYMVDQGWRYVEQLGTTTVFERNGERVSCDLEFKELYAVYKVSHNGFNRTIDQLKKDCPEYFISGAFKGVEVYVWQMAEGVYDCGAFIGTNRDKTKEEIMKLAFNPVSIEEMKSILSYCGVSKNEYVVFPCRQAISSYYYQIDEEYINTVEQLFND